MNQIAISVALTASMGFSCAFAANPKTPKEWDACVGKAESSVDQREVGTAGVEAAISARCGTPPVRQVGTSSIVGVHPYDLVRSKAWRPKFQNLTKAKYKMFVDRLAVSSTTEMAGSWVIGSGLAPHAGGSDEGAFAINTQSGEVFAAMMENGKLFGFGFGTSWSDAPPFLQQWAKERK